MAIIIREADKELGAEEKMIALKILLVIYLHDKRYLDALADIEELLNDPEMQEYRGYLFSRQQEVGQALASYPIRVGQHSYSLFSTSFIIQLNEVFKAFAMLWATATRIASLYTKWDGDSSIITIFKKIVQL